MTEKNSFRELMDRLNQGDSEAASVIFDMYARRLIGLARKRLATIVRTKVDPEDIVQSVFRSFFRRQEEGDFKFSGANDLWSLLAVITLRKCGQRVDYFLAARRDVTKESVPNRMSADSSSSWQHIARDPTPSEAAMLVETMELLLSSLKESPRSILELSLQGKKTCEIAKQLNCSERTVERTMERIRLKLLSLCREGD